MMSAAGMPDLFGEDAVGARGDGHFALGGIGLALFVEGHDDHAGAVAADLARLLAENVFAFLQADGIDDALALQALQPGFDHAPARAIHHDGHARDVRLGAERIQERGHGLLGIEHGLVHVDVDHLRAALDLLARNGQRFFVFAVADQLGESRRAGDVGALADVDEIGVRTNHQRFEAAEARISARPSAARAASRREWPRRWRGCAPASSRSSRRRYSASRCARIRPGRRPCAPASRRSRRRRWASPAFG